MIPQLAFLADRGAARRRPPFFQTKKLAILGNTASVKFAPFQDKSWTLAAHPCCRGKLEREPDWYFDLHGPANFKTEQKSWTPKYYTWLKNLQTPIFMQQEWAEIPMAVKFPRQRVMAEYRAYFTNHCAWMIALAMTEGVTHIGVFGCEYSHKAERGKQRGSLEYWLGVFEGAGGHVILPPGSTVLNDPPELYGYESHDDKGKLKPSYSMPPTIQAVVNKQVVDKELQIIDPNRIDGRIPLMKPPDGEDIAWHRSGHTIYA